MNPPSVSIVSNPAQRLERTMAAARLSFTWLGIRKTLTPGQKEKAAESFGAEGQLLGAAKKLLDTHHPAYKTVSSVKSRAAGYWRSISLPYPEPGIRLIRQEGIVDFDRQMNLFQEELSDAVGQLENQYDALKRSARSLLGDLYDSNDYPPTLENLFSLAWDYPAINPPQYLIELNPGLYEREKARISARFEEAVQLAEQAFQAEFQQLISHLAERLSGTDQGTSRVFRDSSVTHLQEFFQRFQSLNVHSNADLDNLISTAQKQIAGMNPQQLRENLPLQEKVRFELLKVQSGLDALMVDRPRRRILRNPVPEAA